MAAQQPSATSAMQHGRQRESIETSQPTDPATPNPTFVLSRAPHVSEPSTSKAQLHLMPFSINHHGPAEISTYFLTQPAPLEDATPPSSACLQAAFRGRYMHGTTVSLPQGYAGLLISSSSSNPSPIQSQIVPACPPRPARMTSRGRGRVRGGKGAGAAAAAARMKARAAAKPGQEHFLDDSDSEKDDRDAKRAKKVESRLAAQSSDQATAVDGPNEMDCSIASVAASVVPLSSPSDHQSKIQQAGSFPKVLKDVGRFSEIVIWNPDGPLDSSEDVYFRCITKWAAVAELIHRPLPPS